MTHYGFKIGEVWARNNGRQFVRIEGMVFDNRVATRKVISQEGRWTDAPASKVSYHKIDRFLKRFQFFSI
jgi:hypothetical protein